jgi:predicted transposase/invertase (TIGR01784 family)
MKNSPLGRYMNLITDFAFKTVFANENDKELLISFLNGILQGRDTIIEIEFLLPEVFGETEEDRKSIFDLYCKNTSGKRYIIEMQVAKQTYFTDRCLYYASFPIQKQAVKGNWDYQLEPVYIISIVNFTLWKNNVDYINYHSFINEKTHEIISDKLKLITIELTKFNKILAELQSDIDRWLFCFKHLANLKEQPVEIEGVVFDKLFNITELEKLTKKDMEAYKKHVTDYWDVKLAMQCSQEEGFEKGIEVGTKEGNKKIFTIAEKLQKMGLPLHDIEEATGLSPEQIQGINIQT